MSISSGSITNGFLPYRCKSLARRPASSSAVPVCDPNKSKTCRSSDFLKYSALTLILLHIIQINLHATQKWAIRLRSRDRTSIGQTRRCIRRAVGPIVRKDISSNNRNHGQNDNVQSVNVTEEPIHYVLSSLSKKPLKIKEKIIIEYKRLSSKRRNAYSTRIIDKLN